MKFRSAVKVLVLSPVFLGIVISFQNCAPVAFHELEVASLEQPSSIDPGKEPAAEKKCTFNGQEYSEGQTIIAYLTSTVPSGENCQSEERRCTDGSFTGTYAFATCSVDAPSACLFGGKTIAHDHSTIAYQNSTVPFGQSCVSETRQCSNGELSGSYNFDSCTVGAPASCLFNGQTIAHGQTVKGYQNSSVAYGNTCVSEDRQCNNGNLSGSYSYSSCSVGSPNSCLFNGQNIAHGQSVTGYQNSSVPFGQTCSSQSRTCNNGSLSGSFAYASCSVGAPSSCLFNGTTISHGQSVTGYQASSVPYGQTCAAESRTCNNGTLSGSFGYGSCTVGAPSSCLFNGQTIAHGQSVTAYQSSSVAYGQSCVSQSRTCNNGSLSGTYTASSCTAPACVPNQGQACEISTRYYWQSSYFDDLNSCEIYKGNAGWADPCPNPSPGYQWAFKQCKQDSYPTMDGKWRARLVCAESTMGTISCDGQCR